MARTNCRADVLAIVLFLIAITPAIHAKGPDSQPIIAAGTPINVRLKDKLRSNAAKPGDQFRGRLETPITADGRVLYPKGTEVAGYVVRAHASGRMTDPGVLELDLLSIGTGIKIASITTKTLVLKGELHQKSKLPIMSAAAVVPAGAKDKKDSVVESDAVLTWVAVPPGSVPDWSKNPPSDVRRGAGGAPFRIIRHDQPEEPNAGDRPTYGFNDRDRRALRKCIAGRRSGIPPGLAAKNQLPPGSEKQLRKGGTLPAGLQKRVQPLPSVCAQQLSPAPRSWARVVLSGRVMLLDPSSRIVDVFVF